MDIGSYPVSGGAVLGVAVYALISAFGTGQIVGERLIEQSNWQQQCERQITSEIRSNQQARPVLPELNCNSVFGQFFGREGAQFCERYSDVKIPFADTITQHQNRLANANEQRLANAVSKSSSQCGCASALTLEKNRIDFAIYAGSLRVLTPAPVQNLQASLQTSLHSPQCDMSGGRSR